MFRTAARRTSACVPQLRQAQQSPLTRTICSHSARPTLQSCYNKTRPSQIAQWSQTRHLSAAQRIRLKVRQSSKGILRKNPIMFPLAILSVVGGSIAFAYITYVELTRIAPQYHNFPAPVEDALRTAVYYTEIDLNPPRALQAYKEALRLALSLDMHPFSDEVLGIKLQVAMMLERAGLMKASIQVLEQTKSEAMAWIEEGRAMDTAVRDGKVKQEGQGQNRAEPKIAPENIHIDESATVKDTAEELRARAEFEARQRDKVLKKVVGMQMKLAELYGSEVIQEDKKAEEAQVAAVELCLKEMHRRQKLGLPVGGGSGRRRGDSSSGADDTSDEPWLNLTEIATALSELASTYSAKERHGLAMPLYLRALDILRTQERDSPTCKQVVLLNDVASAMAGQAQRPPPQPSAQQVSHEQTIDAARQWAQKAIDVAARIQPPVRDEECDLACVAATYNLGELAELLNKPDVACQRFTEAKSLATGMGYEEGVIMADEALKRVTKK